MVSSLTQRKILSRIPRSAAVSKSRNYPKETSLPFAQGGGTLAGAKITIYNDSIYSVLVNGQEYQPGEVVLSLLTDEKGFVQTDDKALPYGSYYAIEEESPEGYLLNEDRKIEFQIREDGVIVDMTTEPVADQIGRRGFEFKKTVNGEERVANCLFEVTMTATGETHYIVTDPNGVYNSESSVLIMAMTQLSKE